MAPSLTLPARHPVAAPRLSRRRSLAPHVLLVANANASGLVRRPELVEGASSLLRAAGARVETRRTETLEALYEALADAERRVVLLGGDGSLHAAANGPGEKPELALIPAGGANNVARSLGIPSDVRAAARLAISGRPRPIDLIQATTETERYLAVEGISVGFHALARAEYRGRNSADLLAGIKAGLGAFAGFRPITIGLSVDGEATVASVAQLFAVNMPLYGPQLQVAPGADPQDGLLDLVTIQARSRRELIGLARLLRRGRHLGLPGVAHVRARTVRLATGDASPVIADTTNLGRGTVDLTVVPAALALVGGPR